MPAHVSLNDLDPEMGKIRKKILDVLAAYEGKDVYDDELGRLLKTIVVGGRVDRDVLERFGRYLHSALLVAFAAASSFRATIEELYGDECDFAEALALIQLGLEETIDGHRSADP